MNKPGIIPIELLPVGYCQIEITKKTDLNEFSYRILISNSEFRQITSNTGNNEIQNSPFSDTREAVLFNQKRLESYYQVALNNSNLEFEHSSNLTKTSFIVKIKSISSNTVSMVLIATPSNESLDIKTETLINYEKILDSSLDLLIILDKDLKFKFCNQVAKKHLNFYGLNNKQFNPIDFIHPEDRQLALETIGKLLKSPDNDISAEIRVLRNNEEYWLMNFQAKNMLQAPGINGFVINAHNITKQQADKQKLIENELYLESLFRAIPNLIFVLDYEGNFLDFISTSNIDKLAYLPEQFIDKGISSIFPLFISKKVISALKLLKANGRVDPIQYQLKNISNENGYYECHFSIINEDKVLAVVNDISSLKKAEEFLTKNKNIIQRKLDAITLPEGSLSDLELADIIDLEELKDLFLTIHEFTNIPVNLINKDGSLLFSIGMSEICKNYFLKKKGTEQNCFDSNIVNSRNLKIGESKLIKCPNNIWNFISPIFVGNEQLASLNICQFRLAEDTENYDDILLRQADHYNFDKDYFKNSYYDLPLVSKAQLMKVSSYYRDLLHKITALSYAQIKQTRTAHQLKLREEKLTQITNNMSDVIFVLDLNMKVTFVSPSVEKVFGFTPEEYRNRVIEDKYPASSYKKLQDRLKLELSIPYKEQKNVNIEFFEYHANGELIEISFHVQILRDSDNQPIGIIGSGRDITQLKSIEKKLKSQLELQSLLSSIAMQYINIPLETVEETIADSLKKFAQFAKADRAYIFKYNWQKGTVTNTYEWCKEGIDSEIDNLHNIPIDLMKDWNDDLKAGKTVILDDTQGLPDYVKGKQLLLQQHIKSLIFVPLMNDSKCIGFVGFDSVKHKHNYSESDITLLKIFANLLVNISNRITMVNDLSREKVKATESDKLKSNLLWNISHEFRTPLNGIIGLSELLKNKPIKTENQKLAEMIHTSGIRLNKVLDSIMLFSQLESLSETEIIPLEKVNLGTVITSLTEQYKAQISQKGLELTVDVQPNLFVLVNKHLFRHAISHLIINAIKYTHQGFIKIAAKEVEESNEIKLSIEDSGIGIPTDLQQIIFTDFKQVSEGYNRAYEGCGLGLPIAKKAIARMKGKILLESELEKGSIFTIVIAGISKATEQDQLVEQTNKPTKIEVSTNNLEEEKKLPLILIVEDNRVNQKLATLILKQSYQTDSALDGESAIKMITDKQYDLILMDINLGEGLDGIEVTKIIRNDIRYKHTPIVAVTGYTKIGDREHILNQGCSHYLGKPYSKAQLLDVVEEALNQNILS